MYLYLIVTFWFASIMASGSFGLAMSILAQPNSPDMPLKPTEQVRLRIGTFRSLFLFYFFLFKLSRNIWVGGGGEACVPFRPRAVPAEAMCSWQVQPCRIGLMKRSQTKQHPGPPGWWSGVRPKNTPENKSSYCN